MLKMYLILLLTIYLPDGEEKVRMVIQEAPTFDQCTQLGDEIKERLAPMVERINAQVGGTIMINASCKRMELEVNGITQ